MEIILDRFIFILLLVGIIYVIAAFITSFFPPKKINYWYGYRTNNSMKSQQHWNFAQRKSNKEMLLAGILMIIFSTLSFFIPLSENQNLIFGIMIIITLTVIMMYRTEKSIQKKFNQK